MAIRIYMTDDTIFARLPVAYETYYIVDENERITAQLAVPVNGGGAIGRCLPILSRATIFGKLDLP